MGFEEMEGVVYCLRNLVNNKVYVGSTTQPETRKKQHFSDLRHGRHYNKHLQRAFAKYGESNFQWEILVSVFFMFDGLAEAEKEWIERLQGTNEQFGYNMTDEPFAPMRGRRHSAETLAKMRNGSRKGSKHSNSKLDEAQALRVFELVGQGVRRKEISQALGVSAATLSLLLRGKTWKHLSAKTISTRKSKSGITGVYKTANGKWMAEIKKAGKRIHLGTHDEFESAIKARKDAERGE